MSMTVYVGNNYIRVPFVAQIPVKVENVAKKEVEVFAPITGAALSIAFNEFTGGEPKQQWGELKFYSDKEGKVEVVTPTSNANGEYTCYVREGSYKLTIAGGTYEGKAYGAREFYWEATSTKQSVPTGSMFPFAGSEAPHGYLLCDGKKYKEGEYPALAKIIGLSSGEFAVPDLRSRSPLHPDSGAGRIASHNTLKETGGEAKVKLTSAKQLPKHGHTATTTNPSHTHSVNLSDPGHSHLYASGKEIVLTGAGGFFNPVGGEYATSVGGYLVSTFSLNHAVHMIIGGEYINTSTTGITSSGTSSVKQESSTTISETGEEETHENMPPYLVVNWIIKI